MFKVEYGTKHTSSQIVSFTDRNPSYDYVVDSTMDPTRSLADQNDDDLGSFFARPIKIGSYTWGTTLFENFNPWIIYFGNKRVINRLSNFNLLRAKLCVKFVVNGNPFYFGRAIASYTPLSSSDMFTKNRELVSQDLIACSQRPHVYLDPTTCQGGTLCLPFVWDYDSLSIPLGQWSQMGSLNLRVLNALKHANGSADPITISVFAWAEDVTVTVPTSTAPGALVPQMGTMDEYGEGPISKPASAVARIAGALTSVPRIGPFARATQMGADAVSSVASFFGYSRPTSLEPIHYYRARPLGNMANTNYPDTSTKLSVDPKQELSVDPRIVGLGDSDEMTIKSIATRESYLTTFSWSPTDTTEDALFSSHVAPFLWDTFPTTTEDEIHMIPSAFAALPFRNWRGSMKFRFQIVSSSFHKGRLKIVYDPYGFASNEYNTNYTSIVDIAEDKDITVSVGWGNPKGFLEVGSFNLTGLTPADLRFSTTSVVGTGGTNIANGVLAVYVVNPLTEPDPSLNEPISVNVFVSAGDDIEFRNPSEYLTSYSWFPTPDPPAFKSQLGESENPDTGSAPVDPSPSISMLTTLSDTDSSSLVYFGEEIVSFRQLLKRYNFYTISWFDTAGLITGQFYVNKLFQSRFPAYAGAAGYGGMVNASYPNGATGEYNPVRMTLMNYLTPAFLTRRGGIRWKFLDQSREDFVGCMMSVERRANATAPMYRQLRVQTGASLDQFVGALLPQYPSLLGGGEVTSGRVIPSVEVEIPQQGTYRFLHAKANDFTSGVRDTQMVMTALHSFFTFSGGPLHASYASYVAAGEDFSLSGFMGVPVIYVNVSTPDLDSYVT